MTAKNGSDAAPGPVRVQGCTCGAVMVGAPSDTDRKASDSVGMGETAMDPEWSHGRRARSARDGDLVPEEKHM